MKKVIYSILAGVMGLTCLMSAVACGKKEEEPEVPEVPDREAPAFADPAATLTVDATTEAGNQNMQISPDLFGLFLEDINYATQALDDNLVSNSTFATPKAGTTWKMTDMWTATGLTFTVETTAANRLYPTNESYAKIVASAGNKLTNNGFDAVPMAVESGVDYKLGLFIKNANAAFDLTATIKAGANDLGSVTIPVKQNANWVKYERTITATGTASSGVKLELSFGGAADIYMDNVTLETTDSTVGIKNYIYDALDDLGTKFMRFPGGCIIEGATMESAYDWKRSIGATASGGDDTVEPFTYQLDTNGTFVEKTTRGEFATRTTSTNLWNVNNSDHRKYYYTMDYSIGFYEYFVLCESLGASAIPIVNVGLSCQIQSGDAGKTTTALAGRHGNGVDDYIQDALDLVAFALGSTTSSDANERYWAQVRADMGHPAPFDMKYMGIGNEQWSTVYYSKYEQFLAAFKTAAASNPLYGKVQLIVGNGPNFDQCEAYNSEGTRIRNGEAKGAALKYLDKGSISWLDEYGIVDHHYYMGSMDFFSHTDYYDYFDRGDNRYEIFVGEYSANNNANDASGGVYKGYYEHKNNSLQSALAEAAYMTGLERNGDIVRLAAYAPMYGIATGAVRGNSDYRVNPPNHWAADMMFFTNTELLLTPNYYVQQIFMRNSGTLKVKSANLAFASGSMPTTTFNGTVKQGNPNPVSTTIDNLYQIVSVDGETGDIIVKIVNAGTDPVKFNVKIENATLKGIASVMELTCYEEGMLSTATLSSDDIMKSDKFTVGITGDTFGYEVAGYSVIAFRVRTK